MTTLDEDVNHRDMSAPHLMSLVFAVLLTDAAHKRPRLTDLLQTHKLDGMHLMLRAEHLLVRLVSQRDAAVFGQCASGVGELGALGTQVGGTHSAVHGGRVALVLVTPDYTLQEEKEMH